MEKDKIYKIELVKSTHYYTSSIENISVVGNLLISKKSKQRLIKSSNLKYVDIGDSLCVLGENLANIRVDNILNIVEDKSILIVTAPYGIYILQESYDMPKD